MANTKARAEIEELEKRVGLDLVVADVVAPVVGVAVVASIPRPLKPRQHQLVLASAWTNMEEDRLGAISSRWVGEVCGRALGLCRAVFKQHQVLLGKGYDLAISTP